MNRAEIVTSLISAGFYRGQWDLDDDEYGPISADFVFEAWDAWIESLPGQLRETREIGGGKSIIVPRWLPEVWDCDNHCWSFGEYLSRCMAVDYVNTGTPRGNVAAGKLNYAPTPDTGHAVCWFIDHSGAARIFDPGIGEFTVLTDAQLQTISAGESV